MCSFKPDSGICILFSKSVLMCFMTLSKVYYRSADIKSASKYVKTVFSKKKMLYNVLKKIVLKKIVLSHVGSFFLDGLGCKFQLKIM